VTFVILYFFFITHPGRTVGSILTPNGSNDGKICPKNFLKSGVNKQFQAKTPKFPELLIRRKAVRVWSAITLKEIQHGWRVPSWKSMWRHISVVHCPIWTKFGILMQNNTSITVKWSKSKPQVKFYYGGHLFFQNGSSYISAVNWDMSTKFDLLIDWPSEGSDVNSNKTGSSIERPRPPSWEMDMTSYFRSGCSDVDEIR